MPTLYRRKDSPYWWCWDYDALGELWKASTKQRGKKKAQDAARALAQDRFANPGQEPAALSDLFELLRRHLKRKKVRPGTLEKFEQKAKRLERLLGAERDVMKLQLRDLERYVDERRKETYRRVELELVDAKRAGTKKLERHEREQGISDHTIAMEVSTLLAGLRRLKKHGLYDGDPRALWPDVLSAGVYTPRERWLDEGELDALLDAVSAHRRKYVALYALTGMRYSELYQCERAGDVLRVTQTKGNARVGEVKIREVPLTVDARAVLDAEPLPWPKWQKGRMGDDLKRACARIGIARVSANDLRRTFVSWLANAGVPELTVIRLVGHNSSAMVRRVYAQFAPQTLQEAVDRLPRVQAVRAANVAGGGGGPALRLHYVTGGDRA